MSEEEKRDSVDAFVGGENPGEVEMEGETKKVHLDSLDAQKDAQIAQQLEDLQKSLDEREKTFNNEVKRYDDRNINIEQIVQNLNNMPPVNAVAILSEMKDQDIIISVRPEELLLGKESNSMKAVVNDCVFLGNLNLTCLTELCKSCLCELKTEL